MMAIFHVLVTSGSGVDLSGEGPKVARRVGVGDQGPEVLTGRFRHGEVGELAGERGAEIPDPVGARVAGGKCGCWGVAGGLDLTGDLPTERGQTQVGHS
jgi:hypothetical protein